MMGNLWFRGLNNLKKKNDTNNKVSQYHVPQWDWKGWHARSRRTQSPRAQGILDPEARQKGVGWNPKL